MKRKKPEGKSPLIRLVGLEAAAAAASIVGSPALAAPGDLDPAFGDVGRQSEILRDPVAQLWSVDVQDDDAVLFGGGGEYCSYGCYEDYFVGRLLPNGAPDAAFAAGALGRTVVYDTALQPDGKVVGVGHVRQSYNKRSLQVFRLSPDGTLDPTFGLGGLALVGDGTDAYESGHSVIVDPDGRIVVGGRRGRFLLVARLQANGALDASFGTGGVYLGTAGDYSRGQVARAPGGGYRVMSNVEGGAPIGDTQQCSVIGLTSGGALDTAFGTGGFASAPPSGGKPAHCSAFALQTDGKLLLGGTDGDYKLGYLGRLLANGSVDPGFGASVVAGQLRSVTAVAEGANGSIFVAGDDRTGLSGALVVRLLADGALDQKYGRGGVAKVDIATRRPSSPLITDLKVVDDDGVVVAGSSSDIVFLAQDRGYRRRMFVARLLGNVAGSSPGVIGMKRSRFVGTEGSGQVALAVQRIGGNAGSVAVTYATRDFPITPAEGTNYAPGPRAINGMDYTTSTGRLTWADGEVGDKEIVVPIAADTLAERPEFFEVVLDSPEGGVGLGALGADVEIAGIGYPAGELAIGSDFYAVDEGTSVTFRVYRNFYSQGEVSVTVRVTAGGSATPGADFASPGSANAWQDIVVTWGDGDPRTKDFSVPVLSDSTRDPGESFTLELVSPTGGAVLGVANMANVSIGDLPPSAIRTTSPGQSRGGGGGSFGWLGALLLGLVGAVRGQLNRSARLVRKGAWS